MQNKIKIDKKHIIAHRGCAQLAPENTLAAFEKTAELQIPWIEIDTLTLADGTSIIFHDDCLERVTDASGSILEKTWQEVSSLDIGSHFSAHFSQQRIPTLQQALEVLDGLNLNLNLEIKHYPHMNMQDFVQDVIDKLSHNWKRENQLIISSFDHNSLRMIRAQKPQWPLGLLWDELPENWLETAKAINPVSIHCWVEKITTDQVAAIKHAGYSMFLYTVNDAAIGQYWLDQGVDAIFTDNPLLFLHNDADVKP